VPFLTEFPDLHVLAPFNQLKIFCAGAWHNFVLAVLAWLLVSGSSVFMAPLYTLSTEGGAVVADVHPVRTENLTLPFIKNTLC
jgi:hypothetical protein